MTKQLKPTVLQILNLPDKKGGIQAVATVLDKTFRSNGIGCVKSSMKLTSIFKKVIFKRNLLPNIVIVHGMSNLVTLRALIYLLFRRIMKCRPSKTIWQVHFHPFEHHRFPLIAKLYFYIVNYTLALISDVVVAITPDEKKHLQKIVKPSKIKIIPNPLRTFSREENNKIGISSVANLEKFEPYVLTIGRNDFNKNLSAVSALTEVIMAAGFKLKVVTNNDNNIHPNCEVYLNCSDHELDYLITNAYCVIISANYEAFSLVAIESISRGTPVICSPNIGALSFESVRKGSVISDFTEHSFLNSLEKIKQVKNLMSRISNDVKTIFSVTNYGDTWYDLIIDP